MFSRTWVRIPAPYTGWTFLTDIPWKNCSLFEKMKINEKEAGYGPFLLKKSSTFHRSSRRCKS